MSGLPGCGSSFEEGTANLILVGSKEKLRKTGGYDISGAVVVDPATSEKDSGLHCKINRTQAEKGNDGRSGQRTASEYHYPVLWRYDGEDGDVDGGIRRMPLNGAGHASSMSADFKDQAGHKACFCIFLMLVVPDCDMGADGTFIFGTRLEQNRIRRSLPTLRFHPQILPCADRERTDCSHAVTFHKGSAKHADVDKVVEATKIAKNWRRN